MLAVLHLGHTELERELSMSALVRLAAEHELILVYSDTHHDNPAEFSANRLRVVLRHHRVVSLVVGDDLLAHELGLVKELVADGVIPIVFTTGAADHFGRFDADAEFAFRPLRPHDEPRRLAGAARARSASSAVHGSPLERVANQNGETP